MSIIKENVLTDQEVLSEQTDYDNHTMNVDPHTAHLTYLLRCMFRSHLLVQTLHIHVCRSVLLHER